MKDAPCLCGPSPEKHGTISTTWGTWRVKNSSSTNSTSGTTACFAICELETAAEREISRVLWDRKIDLRVQRNAASISNPIHINSIGPLEPQVECRIKYNPHLTASGKV